MIMKYNRIAIKELRLQLLKRNCNVTTFSGVYRWWFLKDVALELLKNLNDIDNNRIMKEQIDGKEYWCLYFGISKNLRQRIKWHTTQKHSTSTVKNGFLSTLRQTISAILNIDETKSEQKVNEIMEYAYWDWCETLTYNEAKSIETDALSSGYFPLNVKENKGVKPSVVLQLKQLRKIYKK